MREIINRILEGNFEYENGSLDFSCNKLELSLTKGEVCEGSFFIYGTPGCYTDGYVYSSDLRMECLTSQFTGSEAEIAFRFHGEMLEEGDVVKGIFSVVSNHGEYYLPFVATVEHTVLISTLGPIKNLFHFANLAKSNWQEAVNLFYSQDFSYVFSGNDSQFYQCYQGLCACPGNEQNVEEFLIQVNKKQKVEFKTEEQELVLEVAAADSPYAVTEFVLTIVRNGWGYTSLAVECEGDFVFTEKEHISDDDFLGNLCRLQVFVDNSHLRQGRNFGRIFICNSYTSMEIPVTVRVGEKTAIAHAHLNKKRITVQLMEFYQAFRMKKISTSTWLKETGKLVEKLVALDEKDVAARLFQAQLLITEERYNEAEWLLDHGAELLEQSRREENTLWAYYLYLTTLIHREEAYVNEVTAKVRQIYRHSRGEWRVAWLLLYLSEEYNKSASGKWMFLEKQFERGCTSPIIYIEALHLLNSNPSLLRKPDTFEQQVLYYGARHDALSGESVEQLLYLCGKKKEYCPVLYKILVKVFRKKQDVRILQEICTMLVKGGKTGTAYFEWYKMGVEAQLRITKLYEYYMLSLDMQDKVEIPKIVLMYFSYQNNLDYEHSACLYHYIISNKERLAEIYDSYRLRMEHFVIDQIQKEHINRHLAALYQELLTPGMITEQTAPALAKLLFANAIHTENRNLCKVYVYRKGNRLPAEYPVTMGHSWVAIYGMDYTIVFEDAWGNRFTKGVEYTLEKLMLPGKFLRMVAHYAKDCLDLNLFLYENERGGGELSRESIDRALSIASSSQADGSLRREIYLKVLQYFYDADDMRSLDDYLEYIPSRELTARDRAGVLKFMVLRGKYQVAYEWLQQYGPYSADAKTLVRLAATIMEQNHMVEDPLLKAAAAHCFKQGKYNSTVLEYLVMHFAGLTRDMRDIWKAAKSFDVDCYFLCENMLVQMLYSGAFIGEMVEVFRYYVTQGAKQEVEEAFLTWCAYDFFVREKVMERYVFQEMQNVYQRGEPLQRVCMLAFLKYFAENPEEQDEHTEPLLETFLKEMLAQRIHLNFFRSFQQYEDLLGEMMDKTIVEYRARPGARARIHYVVVHENGDTDEYVTEYMQEIYAGVCYKEFVLFFGESLQYYIMEEYAGTEQLTQSGNLQKSDIQNSKDSSKYGLINDIAISNTLRDFDTMDHLLGEYYRREYWNERLFILQ